MPNPIFLAVDRSSSTAFDDLNKGVLRYWNPMPIRVDDKAKQMSPQQNKDSSVRSEVGRILDDTPSFDLDPLYFEYSVLTNGQPSA